MKAQDIKVYNTLGLSDMFDRVVLASGTSNRQTRSLAWSVVEKVKEAGGRVISVEGTDPGEWVLVDLGDLVVHIMQPAVRQYYGLEEMWGSKPVRVRLAEERRANRPARTAKAARSERAGRVTRQRAAAKTDARKSAAKTASKKAPARKAPAKKVAAKKAVPGKAAARRASAKGSGSRSTSAGRAAPGKRSAGAKVAPRKRSRSTASR